jgi:Cu/Ag efflux pump CusA
VLGITARSGILLVREFQRLEAAGELTGQSLILHAASERLIPFLATSVTTIAAFAPFVILGDRPGYEVIRPMAVVLLGGLVTATILILFIVPTLYRRVASSPQGDPAGVMVPDAPSLEPSTA